MGLTTGILLVDFYLIPDFLTLLDDLLARWLFRYSSLVLGSSYPGLSTVCLSKLSADLTVLSFLEFAYISKEVGELFSFFWHCSATGGRIMTCT